MDKLWWNEQWMDWPPGPHYAEQSNITHADKLRAPLFLTVGETDRNVDPASTHKFAAALIRANKNFTLLTIPGHGHGAGERPYPRLKRLHFFQHHLGHPE